MAEKIIPKIVPLDVILGAFQTHINKQTVEIATFKHKIKIINDFKDRDYNTFTDAEIKTILSLTCYKHVGYCCGLQKTCIFRDTVLNLLKITPEEYIKAKDQCQRYLLGRKIE